MRSTHRPVATMVSTLMKRTEKIPKALIRIEKNIENTSKQMTPLPLILFRRRARSFAISARNNLVSETKERFILL
jgi:hypothetical protein